MVVDIEKIFAIISCEDPSFVESLKEIAHHGLKVRFKRVVRTATLPCVKIKYKERISFLISIRVAPRVKY